MTLGTLLSCSQRMHALDDIATSLTPSDESMAIACGNGRWLMLCRKRPNSFDWNDSMILHTTAFKIYRF